MHEMNLFFIVFIASAGNQCGTSVFFPADAPARYHAWDEFLHLHVHVFCFYGIKWFIRTGGWWVRNVCC